MNPSDDLKETLRPITSLIEKSTKSLLKLTPGTWHHSKLTANIKALQIARSLMTKDEQQVDFSRNDLRSALESIGSLIEKTAQAHSRTSPGTSQHTLLGNRLKALQAAKTYSSLEFRI